MGIIQAEGRCYVTVGPIHTANVPLAARVGTGRLTRFWGGEEQNHNDNAQTHHETKENLSQIVSHQQPPPLESNSRGNGPTAFYVTAHLLTGLFSPVCLSYRARRILSIPAACKGGVSCYMCQRIITRMCLSSSRDITRYLVRSRLAVALPPGPTVAQPFT